MSPKFGARSPKAGARLGLGAVITLFVLSLGGPAYAANHTVAMSGFTFSPAQLTVHVGDTVTWVHDSSATPHSVTADLGSFDSSPNCPPTCLGAGATFQHTFNQPGTFAYHCRIHGAAGGSGMAGTIVVEPVAATTTTPKTVPPTSLAPAAGTKAPVTAVAGPGTTQPATAAAPAAASAAATAAPAPTLANTGSATGRTAIAGGLCVIVGLGALLARRTRPR